MSSTPDLFDNGTTESPTSTITLFTTSSFFTTSSPSTSNETFHPFFCRRVLYGEFPNTRIRLWDVCMLIPSIVFTCFLLANSKKAISKLKTSSSPVVVAFYVMVWLVDIVKIARTLVAMTVNASVKAGYIADKLLWLSLQFLLLSTEMSVLVFGLGLAHLETGRSVRRVIIITSIFALLYSLVQTILEFVLEDPLFYVTSKQYHLYSHGGRFFLLLTSLFNSAVYATISILPYTQCQIKEYLPAKKSFYFYCYFMSILNLIQFLGSFLLCLQLLEGFCLVNLTTFLYFTCFDPLVYAIFLRGYFSRTKGMFAFLYRPHYDMPDPGQTLAPESGVWGHPGGSRPPPPVDMSTADRWRGTIGPQGSTEAPWDPMGEDNDIAYDDRQSLPIGGRLDIDYDYFSGQGPSDIAAACDDEEATHSYVHQPPPSVGYK